MKDFKIFISYSWKNKDEVEKIDNDFQAVGVTFIRDVRDLNYRQSIKEFMGRIGEADFVLMIISDSYLKSMNCMYEVLEFIKDQKYKDRILHIVLDDCKDIFTPAGRAKYVAYWQDEFEEINEIVSSLDPMNRGNLQNDLKFIESICRNISDFISVISDMVHIPLYELREKNYKHILDFIKFDYGLSASERIRISLIDNIEEQDLALEEYQEKFGKKDTFYNLKAYLESKRKLFKKSKYYYLKAIELNPCYAKAHNNLAVLLAEEYKDYELAKEHYLKAIEHNFAGAHYNMANLLKNEYKDYEGAKEHYLKAIKLEPNYAKAHNNLAILLKNVYKKYDSAREHFNKAIELEPDYTAAYSNLAILLENAYQDYNGAKKHLLKAIEFNPNDAYAYYNLADLLENEYFKDYEGAKRHRLKAIELNPNLAKSVNID